jgi:hypothetical protein
MVADLKNKMFWLNLTTVRRSFCFSHLTIPTTTIAKLLVRKLSLERGSDNIFHVDGELKLISKEDMKEIFLLILHWSKPPRERQ